MRDSEESKNIFTQPTQGTENCNQRAESDKGRGDATAKRQKWFNQKVSSKLVQAHEMKKALTHSQRKLIHL